MKNQELENKINSVQEFIALWVKFHNLYKAAANDPSTIAISEKDFLDLVSLITRRYQALLDSLNIQLTSDDRTFDVVSQIHALNDVASISELQMQKIETDWHNSYISLNKLLGSLENRRDELARVSSVKTAVNRMFSGPLTSLVAIIAAIVIIYFIYAKFFK